MQETRVIKGYYLIKVKAFFRKISLSLQIWCNVQKDSIHTTLANASILLTNYKSMKKSILFLLGLFMGITGVLAQGFPTISTDENTKWYLIQFMNGGNALTAETSGAQITTSAAIGSEAQLENYR